VPGLGAIDVTENSLLILLAVGAVSGWLAGVVVKGYGFGLIGNVVVGIIGAFVGNWLFAHFHVVRGAGILAEIVGATLGAVVLLLLIRLARRVA
jgi:uncharacterized membrane protein YeaQ/YmgE (transglycosylase-associated protein family)